MKFKDAKQAVEEFKKRILEESNYVEWGDESTSEVVEVENIEKVFKDMFS